MTKGLKEWLAVKKGEAICCFLHFLYHFLRPPLHSLTQPLNKAFHYTSEKILFSHQGDEEKYGNGLLCKKIFKDELSCHLYKSDVYGFILNNLTINS